MRIIKGRKCYVSTLIRCVTRTTSSSSDNTTPTTLDNASPPPDLAHLDVSKHQAFVELDDEVWRSSERGWWSRPYAEGLPFPPPASGPSTISPGTVGMGMATFDHEAQRGTGSAGQGMENVCAGKFREHDIHKSIVSALIVSAVRAPERASSAPSLSPRSLLPHVI